MIIEHQFISNPAHAAEFKDLGDNSKVDYIGWADAWAIWEMYHSDTWWNMRGISAVQQGNKVTVKPVLTGVVTGATFTFGYTAPDGSWTTVAYKTTDTSISFVPPMTGRYVLYLKAISSDGQEITRQMNFEATEGAVTGWKQVANGWMYTDDNGFRYVNRWLNDADSWHYFGAQGIATSGWITTADGKTFYADPSSTHNAVKLGQFTVQNRDYYADTTAGVIKDGWVNYGDGNWVWANTDGSLYAGWKLLPNGKWFYFDESAEYPLLKTGVFTISSGSYYVDVNKGMTSNDWVQLPNNGWTWAQSSGALASGWFNTPNGKTWYFDPTTHEHAALIGLQVINGSYYYFDLGYGLLRNQDVTLSDGRVVHADASGVLNIKPTDKNNDKDGNVDDNNGKENSDAGNNNTPADDNSPIEPTRGNFSDRTSVLGAPLVSKEDLQRDFNKRVGSAYPAIYAEKGAATGADFVNQLWQAAIDEGVRPELLYAQVMIETGNLRFGRDVLPEQCNFGGLGATGNGAHGNSFDTVLKGLRAQALHLRAYAGFEPLTVDPSKARDVDPRYGAWILAKKANIIRKLAGTWATDKNYAVKLVRVMNEL